MLIFTQALWSWKTEMIKKFSHHFVFQKMAYNIEPFFLIWLR